MLTKIKSALKNPLFYVGAVLGVVLAFAYGSRLTAVKPLAAKLPGADA